VLDRGPVSHLFGNGSRRRKRRAILGALDGDQLSLTEVHRFVNEPVRLPDGLHWDILRLWSEIKTGLGLAVRQHDAPLATIGLDTWGVDYGLLDGQGRCWAIPITIVIAAPMP